MKSHHLLKNGWMQLETTVSNKTCQAQDDRCPVQTEADMRREAGLPRKGLATAEAEKWDPMGENMATINGSHEETVLMKHITVYNKYSETKTFIFNGGIKGLESQLSGEEDLFIFPQNPFWSQHLQLAATTVCDFSSRRIRLLFLASSVSAFTWHTRRDRGNAYI